MILLLAIVTLIVFWQVQNYEFVNFDDSIYILENQHVRSGLSLKNISWAFTTLHGGFWFPLTWLSHMLDCQLYGLNPKGHHFNNLLLHIVNTVLLFLVLNRMTGALWRSAFVASLFALHPLHVEPVAWISSRKDVLSTLFWMLTLWFYVSYAKNNGIRGYLLVVLFFILGLMSKPMLVTLPFVMLLLDYWPLKRIAFSGQTGRSQRLQELANRRTLSLLIFEKSPFIALSIILSFIIYFAERSYGALPSLQSYPLATRFANALSSYMVYIFKMVWPRNLVFFYPHTGMPRWWITTGALMILLVITACALKFFRRYPYLAVGWLWYLVTLVPVIGFIQIGSHAMADRYTYIPLIGLFIMLAWGANNLLENRRFKKQILAVTGGTLILLFMMVSWSQLQHWRNSISLFRHAIEKNPDNYIAHNNLGLALLNKGMLDEAFYHFSEAMKIKPHNLESLNNMGVILARYGRIDEAIPYFSKVLQMDPNSAGSHFNLGMALIQKKRIDEAASHFIRALEIKPDYPEAHFKLGLIFFNKGEFKKAETHFSKALSLKPDDKKARYFLEIAQKKDARFTDRATASE